MAPTNYDQVAPSYDERYVRNDYPGSEACLQRFAGATPQRILEVGCGSGHWLARLAASGHRVAGVDASSGMLAKARAKLPAHASQLLLGLAESLPFPAASFDRVVIINALHHFHDAQQALREARRVLGEAGAVLIIGMDPASGQDSWCIYDYFAGTLEHDRKRYPAASTIRAWLHEAGFARSRTVVAERIEDEVPARQALADGALARHVTSQLSELSDAAYAQGLAAIDAACAVAEARGEALMLRARLQLFATLGEVEGGGT